MAHAIPGPIGPIHAPAPTGARDPIYRARIVRHDERLPLAPPSGRTRPDPIHWTELTVVLNPGGTVTVTVRRVKRSGAPGETESKTLVVFPSGGWSRRRKSLPRNVQGASGDLSILGAAPPEGP